MPIYEFKCQDCGKISEYFINADLKEEIVCKYCGSKNVIKIFSPVSILNNESFSNRKRGKTCCGREERCSKPPCFETGVCRREVQK